jgi:HB1/ASXL restriction endonuclease-like protein with HTH domain
MPGLMPLHEAIEQVLTDAGRPMHVSEIANEVARHGLYERRDGGPILTNQIHARIAKPEYRDRFTVSDGVVRLA